MGNVHSQYLRPHGLLVNGTFCVEGRKIRNLHAFAERGLALPVDEWTLRRRMGIDQNHWNMIEDIMSRLLQVYQAIHADCHRYSDIFERLEDVCSRIARIASHAREVYDPLFKILIQVFNEDLDDDDDDDDNDLRNEVRRLVYERLQAVKYIEYDTKVVTARLNEWDNACAEHKYRLAQVVRDLENRQESTVHISFLNVPWKILFGRDDIIETLESSAEEEIRDLRSAITDMQSLLGGWTAVSSDLEDLSKAIRDNVEPTPVLLAHLNENSIIDEWEHLAREVQKVNNEYIAPAARGLK